MNVQIFSQGIKDDVKFTSGVGDSVQAVYNEYRARQIELVALITIFSL